MLNQLTTLQQGLVVLTAYYEMQSTGDQASPYIQEANFWYATHIDEPGWKVIIDYSRKHMTLVRPEMSKMQYIFGGAGLSDEDATQVSGADEIISSQEFEEHLRQLARKHSVVSTIFEDKHAEFILNPAQKDLKKILERIFPAVQDCTEAFAKSRAIKSADEIARIKQAVRLTVDAFKHVRSSLAESKYEYEIEAEFTYRFRSQGASHAYAPIVANGGHACTLHYGKNNGKVAKNKLTLIDVGARVNGYCADITRTYSTNPTKRQREVHAAVTSAHMAIIELLGPDVSIQKYHEQVDEIMKDALISIGLLMNRHDEQTYRTYFPHAVSHGLGIDTHDPLGRPREFQPGMVVTVEPGIYIPEEGIGVRIEDNILITATGRENLSRALPIDL